MKKLFHKLLVVLISALLTMPIIAFAQDYFRATGIPVQRSAISSSEFRSEFSSIETSISDKLPAYTGNGDRAVVVNAGGTALTVADAGTFDVTLSGGCTSGSTRSWDYVQTGAVVTIDTVANTQCTSNGTTFTASGTPIPSALRPTVTVLINLGVLDAGSATFGCISFQSDGQIKLFTLGAAGCQSGWTNTGVKMLPHLTFTYIVDN